MNVFKAFYERMFKALTADGDLVPGLVPEVNIFAEDDPGEPIAGNSIYYTWANFQWDPKSRRGTGVLRLVSASVDHKMVAHDILEQVRESVTPRTLTGALDDGGSIRVHLFREQTVGNDVTQDAQGRFQVLALFDVRLVESD